MQIADPIILTILSKSLPNLWQSLHQYSGKGVNLGEFHDNPESINRRLDFNINTIGYPRLPRLYT